MIAHSVYKGCELDFPVGLTIILMSYLLEPQQWF